MNNDSKKHGCIIAIAIGVIFIATLPYTLGMLIGLVCNWGHYEMEWNKTKYIHNLSTSLESKYHEKFSVTFHEIQKDVRTSNRYTFLTTAVSKSHPAVVFVAEANGNGTMISENYIQSVLNAEMGKISGIKNLTIGNNSPSGDYYLEIEYSGELEDVNSEHIFKYLNSLLSEFNRISFEHLYIDFHFAVLDKKYNGYSEPGEVCIAREQLSNDNKKMEELSGKTLLKLREIGEARAKEMQSINKKN